MKTLVTKPIGKVLEQAGLISESHISTALKIQSRHNQVRFGKILVAQGIIKQQTVDFFVKQLPKLLQQSHSKPLGYYFQKAALITPLQIETLLEEQEQTGMLLGELALEKKLVNAKTLNFFLQHLGKIQEKPKLKLKFLSPSQEEIIQSFHLETLAAAPYSLIKEVLSWTGGHPLLTQEICRILADCDYDFIPAGTEVFFVKVLVLNYVIDNWRNQVLGEYLKTLENYLLNNHKCLPENLLKVYLKILNQEEISSDFINEKKELMNLGLVIEQENKLKVSNLIYKSIFNKDWVKQQLYILENIRKSVKNNSLMNKTNLGKIHAKNKVNNYFLALFDLKIIASLSLLLILIILILLNNYQYQKTQEKNDLSLTKNKILDSQNNNNSSNLQLLSSSAFCIDPIPEEVAIQEDWLIHLEQKKQRLKEQFPESCQNNLDQLLRQLNPQNYEFYENYQQALAFLERSDNPKSFEQLYQAAEKAIMINKADLLLKELLKNEATIFQPVVQNDPHWQSLKDILVKADNNDYQLLYQRAKLKLTTDYNRSHDREFELLFAAAQKAITNQKAEMMLSQLKQDQQDRFKNLAIGHPQWTNLITALEQNNLQLLEEK